MIADSEAALKSFCGWRIIVIEPCRLGLVVKPQQWLRHCAADAKNADFFPRHCDRFPMEAEKRERPCVRSQEKFRFAEKCILLNESCWRTATRINVWRRERTMYRRTIEARHDVLPIYHMPYARRPLMSCPKTITSSKQ